MPTALARIYRDGPLTPRARYEQLRASLWNVRQGGGFDSHWQEIADVIFPRRVRFQTSDQNKGDKRSQAILDSTGKFAASTLRSGLHAGLTSPARPWFTLSTPDPDLAEFAPVKEWLHTVTERMRAVFASTNLYNALPTVYQDFGVFGTGAMAALGDSKDLFRTFTYPIGSYAIGLDERGIATTFVHQFRRSVRQIVKEFALLPNGDLDWTNVSSVVKEAWERGDYENPVDVVWVVQPNDDADRSKLGARYLPWSSCHYEAGTRDDRQDGDKVLRESGFHEFPLMVPRWDVTGGDVYGTDCPGMTALGDIKQLQSQQRVKAKLLAKAADPPLRGPASLRTQKTSLVAGDITYVDAREGQQGLAPIHEVRLEGFQHISADIGDGRQMIRRAFYEDLFLMLASGDPFRGNQPRTAREVEERHEEKLIALGPTLERTNDELLTPLVDRVYALMERAGLVPEVPDELDGVALKVEFTSILAQAQKLLGIAALDRFSGSIAGVLQVFPEARHKIRAFNLVDAYADALSVPPRIIRDDEEAQQLADAEAQQQQQAQAAEQAKALAGAAGAAGARPIAPDSALDRVLEAGVGR